MMTLIAAIQIPKLAIAVAQRDDPALAEQPLILYTAKGKQAIVAVASDETGLAAGTPLRQAAVRYPHAVFRPTDIARNHQMLNALLTLLQAFSPQVAAQAFAQDARIDLDLGRIGIPDTIALTQRLTQRIQASLGLTPALGVARTRFVAQRAAQQAGRGVTVLIPPGHEAAFLAPQPITTLPIDDTTIRQLQLFGLHTIGVLAKLPVDALQAHFGAIGHTLYHLARGESDDPIAPTAVAPTLSQRRRFAGPLTNRLLLETAISRLLDRLGAQLTVGGWAARTIALMLTLEDGESWTAQRTLSTPTAEPAVLNAAFLALCRTAQLEAGVEALTLEINDLAPTMARQLDLFAPMSGQSKQLEGTLERLRTRYASSFVRAQITSPNAHLPEQRVRFDPWDPR
jgi:DNA polymerase IV